MECNQNDVWVATRAGPLCALAPSDGCIVHTYQRDRGYSNDAGPHLVGGRVHADAGARQEIVARDVNSDQEFWRSKMIGTPNARLVGGKELLWLSNFTFLYVFRATDGKLVVTQQLNDKGISEAPLLLTKRDAILPLENGIARVTLRDR